jgi:hypothetical protein
VTLCIPRLDTYKNLNKFFDIEFIFTRVVSFIIEPYLVINLLFKFVKSEFSKSGFQISTRYILYYFFIFTDTSHNIFEDFTVFKVKAKIVSNGVLSGIKVLSGKIEIFKSENVLFISLNTFEYISELKNLSLS